MDNHLIVISVRDDGTCGYDCDLYHLDWGEGCRRKWSIPSGDNESPGPKCPGAGIYKLERTS